MMPKKFLELGSVSSGTLKPEDLIPAFHDALKWVSPSSARECRVEYRDVFRWLNRHGDLDGAPEDVAEGAGWVVDDLTDRLGNVCPPFTHFGSHMGDGADFGVWVVEDLEQEAKYGHLLYLDDEEPLPPCYSGYYFRTKDRGSTGTLYHRNKRYVTRTIWSI